MPWPEADNIVALSPTQERTSTRGLAGRCLQAYRGASAMAAYWVPTGQQQGPLFVETNQLKVPLPKWGFQAAGAIAAGENGPGGLGTVPWRHRSAGAWIQMCSTVTVPSNLRGAWIDCPQQPKAPVLSPALPMTQCKASQVTIVSAWTPSAWTPLCALPILPHLSSRHCPGSVAGFLGCCYWPWGPLNAWKEGTLPSQGF